MSPRAHDFGTSGVLDVWRSRRQDAKTSIRIDFLISLFHDGLSSRVIHPVLVQFCSRCRLRERVVHLFRLVGEQVGTGLIFDPFLSPRNMICFGTQQAVFSVTRNRFRNRKQLPARGWRTPPKSSFFTGHPVCRDQILTTEGFSTPSDQKWIPCKA